MCGITGGGESETETERDAEREREKWKEKLKNTERRNTTKTGQDKVADAYKKEKDAERAKETEDCV